MDEIVAICPKEFPGVTAVFRDGEKLGLWKFYELHKPFPKEAKLFILGAWHPYYRMLFPDLKGKKTILITSTPAQLEMGVVDMEFLRLIQEFKNRDVIDDILCGSLALAEWLDAKYFPYPIWLSPDKAFNSIEEKVPNCVGLFLPYHYRKNIFNQIIALKLLQKRIPTLEVFTNLNPYYLPSFCKFVGWRYRAEYLQLLRTVQVFLHVTWTESLAYGVIDALREGTLPLVSTQVQGFLGSSFFVPDSDNPDEIADALEFMLNLPRGSYLQAWRSDLEELKNRAKPREAILNELLKSKTG